jgi:hypothetical protein
MTQNHGNNGLLHKNNLPDFIKWLTTNQGWVEVPTGGEYEVARLRRNGTEHPMIIYRRKREHLGYSVVNGLQLLELWCDLRKEWEL